MRVPGLEPPQIIASSRMASALRYFLLTHGVRVPDGYQVAIGEGELDTEKRVLVISYDFFQPIDWDRETD